MFGADMRRVNIFILSFIGFLFAYYGGLMLLDSQGVASGLRDLPWYVIPFVVPLVAGTLMTFAFGLWRQDATRNERRIAFLAVILLTIMMAALTMFIGFVLFYACLRGC